MRIRNNDYLALADAQLRALVAPTAAATPVRPGVVYELLRRRGNGRRAA